MMRGDIVFIGVGIALIGLSAYILYIMGIGAEYAGPIVIGIGGGMVIGIGIILSKARRLEEVIRGLQEVAKPKGMRMIMPWDDEVIRLMVQRSYPKIATLIRERVEGVASE